jgi:penicillin-binding protein 2
VASEVLHKVPNLSDRALQTVKAGLWKVVNEEGGTGGNARITGLNVAGKTGTVQVVAQHGWIKAEGMPFRERDHAWFASYAPGAPDDTPQMVVVVFVEHGGHGGADAAPLAKLLYESRFRGQVLNTRLDLSNPDTLQAIKEGEAPVPGQTPKAPPVPAGTGH